MNPRALLVPLLFVAASAVADSAYQLDVGADVRANSLKVEPTVSGPANKTLRYRMEVTREGGGSTSSQSGSVHLDGSGHGRLASTSVSISPSQRYRVTVKLFDGNELVAQQSAQYP